MKSSTLLPCIDGIRIESIANTDNSIVLHLTAVASSAHCPLCGRVSQQLHSHYQRTLADLPWNRISVRIHLRARKFYCHHSECPRRIFTEPLPELAARYARKTNRLQEAFYLIGYALGGEAGARVAMGLGLRVSPDTLLNRVRQVAISHAPQMGEVRVLGVDDWAYRRRHRYGTLLVDLERHRLVDLLPDRSGESVADWLRAHPEIQFVCRDRAECYAEGAREGAPQAIQIADRWHLFKNVTDALETVLSNAKSVLREAALDIQAPPDGNHAPTSVQKQAQAAEERRQERFSRRQELLAQLQQHPVAEIAKQLEVSQSTVYRWQALKILPSRKGMPCRERLIDPFTPYLKQRWEAGCHNGAQLLREIQAQGFTGTAAMLRYLLKEWRVPLREQKARQRRWVPSAQQATWLLLRSVKKRRPEEHAFVQSLLQRAPAVQKAYDLTVSFFALLRKQNAPSLEEWFTAMETSDVPTMQQCAAGMVKDKEAIAAAVAHPYSNGQTEGQVHRLKLIKRSMYGRAKFDLLRARVLPMAQIS